MLAVIAIPQLCWGRHGPRRGRSGRVGAAQHHGDTGRRFRRCAPVHEAVVVCSSGWVHTLSNVATLIAALAIVGAVIVLARQARLPRPYLVAAVIVANPWFIIAATSTVDFPMALAFLLWGAIALQRDQTVIASVCFALAVGCRATTILLVMVALVAEVTGEAEQRKPRRALVCGALASVLVLCAVPPCVRVAGWSRFARTTPHCRPASCWVAPVEGPVLLRLRRHRAAWAVPAVVGSAEKLARAVVCASCARRV